MPKLRRDSLQRNERLTDHRTGHRTGHPTGASRENPPRPAAPPAPGDLPASITFFVTQSQREAVLRVIRPFGRRRGEALLRALRARTPKGGA